MPAPRDLTGLRFGRLTVSRRDGRVFWGCDQAAWMCRCDCGADLRVPQKRLTTKNARHQMHACEVCRARPCDICGKPVPVSTHSKTCSPECAAERERRYQWAWYRDTRTPDQEDAAQRMARARDQWAAMTPAERREQINARARRRHEERASTDPDYIAGRAAAKHRHHEKIGPEAVREYSRRDAQKRRAARAEIELLRAMDRMNEDSPDE